MVHLGCGFKYFLFSFLFGECFHFDSYVSDGFKPPTSSWLEITSEPSIYKWLALVYWSISTSRTSQWVFPKNRGVSPKMDGEKNGIFPIQMDDLGGFSPTIFWKHPSNANLPCRDFFSTVPPPPWWQRIKFPLDTNNFATYGRHDALETGGKFMNIYDVWMKLHERHEIHGVKISMDKTIEDKFDMYKGICRYIWIREVRWELNSFHTKFDTQSWLWCSLWGTTSAAALMASMVVPVAAWEKGL